MSDNVQFQSNQLATPASGTQVSTDEAASGHIQRVKLAYSADGVDTHIQADADGLLVNNGAHKGALSEVMDLTDIGLASKSAIYGYSTSQGGSFEPVKVTPSGALTVEVSDGDGSLTVDGTVAATQSGTWNVGITGNVALPAGAATEYSLGLLGSNLATVTTGSNLRVLGLVDARQSGPYTVGGTVDATQSGAWNITNVSGTVSLPTGASTSANQTTIIGHLDGVEGLLTTIDADTSALAGTVAGTELQVDIVSAPTITVADGGGSLTIDGTVGVSGTVTVDGSGVTQPVSGTVTVQDGGNSITVDGTVAATQSGSWTVTANAGTGPFPVSDNGGSLTVDGTVGVSGTVTVDGSGVTQPVSGTVTIQDGGNVITVDGTVAATQSGSWTVTANAGTGTFAVGDGGGSLTVDNGGTFAVQAAQSGTWNINNVAGTVSLPTGAATESSLATVAGAVSSSNIRVVESGLSLPISSSAAETYSIDDQATSATLLDANASRKGWAIYNDSTSTLYLRFGATASTTAFTVALIGGAYYEQLGHGVYAGRVDGIWSADGTGAARVTEW